MSFEDVFGGGIGGGGTVIASGAISKPGLPLTMWAGHDFGQQLEMILPTGWQVLYWTVKDGSDVEENVDSVALIQLKLTNGGDAGDGLVYLNRASHDQKTDGAIVYETDIGGYEDAGRVSLIVKASATSQIDWRRNFAFHDFSVIMSGGSKPVYIKPAKFFIKNGVTKSLT